MGRPFGELKLAKIFEDFEVELQNYYGAVNQRKMNIPVDMPEKPRAVIIQEQIEEYDELPFPGGLMAQPHILMRELKLVIRVRNIFTQSLPKG